jgi:hypothetical protein
MNSDQLIEQLRERIQRYPAVECDAGTGRCNERGEHLLHPPANPPLSLAAVEAVEAELGFRLPTLVRRLYTEVADGAYGPNWGINPLGDPATIAAEMERMEMESVLEWDGVYRCEDWWVHAPRPAYPRHFIRLNEVGCNISVLVDCTTEEAWLLRDDPNSDTPLTPFQQTLEQWLSRPWPAEMYRSR